FDARLEDRHRQPTRSRPCACSRCGVPASLARRDAAAELMRLANCGGCSRVRSPSSTRRTGGHSPRTTPDHPWRPTRSARRAASRETAAARVVFRLSLSRLAPALLEQESCVPHHAEQALACALVFLLVPRRSLATLPIAGGCVPSGRSPGRVDKLRVAG